MAVGGGHELMRGPEDEFVRRRQVSSDRLTMVSIRCKWWNDTDKLPCFESIAIA